MNNGIWKILIIKLTRYLFLGDFTQKTQWHKISVFKPNLRDVVYNYLKKGQRVMVNGRLNYSEYKDDEGNFRTNVSIIADDVIFFQ